MQKIISSVLRFCLISISFVFLYFMAHWNSNKVVMILIPKTNNTGYYGKCLTLYYLVYRFIATTLYHYMSSNNNGSWTYLIPTYLIQNLSDSEPIWFRTYLIPRLSDSEAIWFRGYLIPNLSDSEPIPIWFRTYLIPNPSDSEPIWF